MDNCILEWRNRDFGFLFNSKLFLIKIVGTNFYCYRLIPHQMYSARETQNMVRVQFSRISSQFRASKVACKILQTSFPTRFALRQCAKVGCYEQNCKNFHLLVLKTVTIPDLAHREGNLCGNLLSRFFPVRNDYPIRKIESQLLFSSLSRIIWS